MKKDKLLAIGEALIDFAPVQTGVPLKDVLEFKRRAISESANVCGAFSKLGGRSGMITQLGADGFGDCIVEELEHFGIDTSMILRTGEANTALAFVSLGNDGSRDFSFYRNPSADMLFPAEALKKDWFNEAFALHFCSVALVPSPMRGAHDRAIQLAAKAQAIISFDPNVRLPLWADHEALRETIRSYIPKAHIVKISDEELEFITGKDDIYQAAEVLFTGNVELIIYTMGSSGAICLTKSTAARAAARSVQAVDTTGAGDGFIGAFLYQLCRDGIGASGLSALTRSQLENYIAYANVFCEYSVFGNGAIASYPTSGQLEDYISGSRG